MGHLHVIAQILLPTDLLLAHLQRRPCSSQLVTEYSNFATEVALMRNGYCNKSFLFRVLRISECEFEAFVVSERLWTVPENFCDCVLREIFEQETSAMT